MILRYGSSIAWVLYKNEKFLFLYLIGLILKDTDNKRNGIFGNVKREQIYRTGSDDRVLF